MTRPDLTTLACVNADCQHYGCPSQGNLTIRKVYGQNGIGSWGVLEQLSEAFHNRSNTPQDPIAPLLIQCPEN